LGINYIVDFKILLLLELFDGGDCVMFPDIIDYIRIKFFLLQDLLDALDCLNTHVDLLKNETMVTFSMSSMGSQLRRCGDLTRLIVLVNGR
jgi:hypothetical protein